MSLFLEITYRLSADILVQHVHCYNLCVDFVLLCPNVSFTKHGGCISTPDPIVENKLIYIQLVYSSLLKLKSII